MLLLAITLTVPTSGAAPAPPPPPPSATPVAATWYYQGPVHKGTFTLEQIAAFVRETPDAEHFVWQPGWPAWKSWKEVPEIAAAMTPVATTYWYSAGGAPVELDAAAIAERVRANPGAQHLVWREGMSGWMEPAKVADVSVELGKLPPPLPAGPPPLPPASHVPGGVPPPFAPEAAQSPPGLSDVRPEGGPGSAAAAPSAALPAPAPPAQVPPQAEPPKDGLRVEVGAELRVNFVAENLERVGDDTWADDPAGFAFVLSRLRPRIDVTLNRHTRARAMFEVHQTDAVTTYEAGATTISVPQYADGWTIQGREIYVERESGDKVHHRFRAGVQKTAFGVRDWFDGFDNYYLGGLDAYEDVERRAGLVFAEDVGLGYRIAAKEDRWSGDLQILNGSGFKVMDDNNAKDIIVRLAGRPVSWTNLSVSALFGARGATGDQQVRRASVAAELRGPHQRVMGEFIAGRTEEGSARDEMAYMAAAAWDFEMTGVLDRVSVVGRFQGYDPDTSNSQGADAPYPDNWWSSAAAAQFYWNAVPKTTLLTGLSWEMMVPENLEEPITQALVAQVACKF